jgi:hypothetical protein
MKSIKKAAYAVILSAALLAGNGSATTVRIGIEQMALTYADSSYLNEITSGSIRIGRLEVAEDTLAFSGKTSFDAFLADSTMWVQYGNAATYLRGDLDGTYEFSNLYLPFVQNAGVAGERPFQLYVAVTSGADLFGLFTWRGNSGDVSRFALTDEQSPVFDFTNENFDDGRLNLESVRGYGAVRMLNGSVDSAVALVPEPSSASLLLLGSVLLLGVSSIRRASEKNVRNKLS